MRVIDRVALPPGFRLSFIKIRLGTKKPDAWGSASGSKLPERRKSLRSRPGKSLESLVVLVQLLHLFAFASQRRDSGSNGHDEHDADDSRKHC